MKKGWRLVRLGDLTETITKGTTPTTMGYQYLDKGVNFVKVESISARGDILPDMLAHVGEDCHKAFKRSQLRKGDILFSIAGALGRTALVSDEILPANTNQALAIVRLRPSSEILPTFVLKALASDYITEQIEKQRGGVAQQNLSLTQLADFRMPLPSISEQRRIAAILDEAFEVIAAARTNAEKDLANVRELFETFLNSFFEDERSPTKSFHEICGISSRLVDPRKAEFVDLPHIGAGNIVGMIGELVDVQTARQESLKSGKFLFNSHMVLYSKIRPYLIKVCRPDFDGLCSADVYPLSPIDGEVSRNFLYYLLLSKKFTEYAISGSARAGMPKVNRDHLFRYRCRIPALTEQMEIALKLDALSKNCQELQKIYRRKLCAVEDLKKSVLRNAFEGKLQTMPDDAFEVAAE